MGEPHLRGTSALLVKIAPFPVAQIELAILRPMSIEQFARPPEIIRERRLVGKIHVVEIQSAPGSHFARLSFHPASIRLDEQSRQLPLRASRAVCLPEARNEADDECRSDCRRRRQPELVSPGKLPEAISPTGRSGADGFVGKITLNVASETVGRRIAARAIFLDRF